MAYVKIIEQSQTWTCPHDGTYLVTCVGGGAGGELTNPATIIPGETSGFGSFLSATGGNSNSFITGGYTPSDGVYGGISTFAYGNEYRSATKNGITYGNSTIPTGGLIGIGYGAGTLMSKSSTVYIGSSSGKLMTGTFEFSEGNTVACTVGKGGVGADTTGVDGVIVIKEV